MSHDTWYLCLMILDTYVSWYLRVVQNLKKSWFFDSQMTRIWWIMIRALKSLKICTFIGTFCAKYIMFDLKKYRRVVIHDTKESSKIWRKTDLCFQKWHEEFSNFLTEHFWKAKNWDFGRILLSKVENIWA